MYRLIIEDDEGKTTAVPILRDEITVGRKEGNTIRLTERNISRYHAKLRRINGQLTIEDLDSYNGVNLNGSRITGNTPIRAGDIIKIGDYYMTVREDTSVAEEDLLARVSPAPSASKPAPFEERMQALPEMEEGEEGDEDIVKTPTDVIRLQKLMSESASGGVGEAKPLAPPYAKLITLTTEKSGEHHIVDRTPATLGSAADCSIRIEHPSLAPKHLTIEYQDGKYFMKPYSDEISPPLVNGSPLINMPLQKGDIIEIGKVKFRFVSPRESYKDKDVVSDLPDKKAPAPTPKEVASSEFIPQTDKWTAISLKIKENSKYLGAAFGIGILFGFLLALLVLPRGAKESKRAVAEADALEKQVAALSVAVSEGLKKGVDIKEDTRSPYEIANDVIDEANSYMDEGNYKLAAEKLEAFMGRFKGHKAAREPKKLLEKALTELTNKDLLAKGIAFVEAGDWDNAWETLTQIGPESDYNAPAVEILEEVAAHKFEKHFNTANELKTQNKLKEALKEYETALMFDTNNEEALKSKNELERKLYPQKSASPPKKAASTKAPPPKAPPKEAVAKTDTRPPPQQQASASSLADPKDLVAEGNKAFLKNSLDEALNYYRQALQKNPRFAPAYRGMGITYAKQGKARQAVKAYEKYLALSPNASDAQQVRAMIRDYYKTNPQ